MSTIALPKSSLERLEKISRSFVWGSTVEKKKQHLIAWTRVCQAKSDGGLGIRSAQEMNKALLAKIGWRLLHDNSSLWALVLRAKYRIGNIHETNWRIGKGTWSPTWRSIIRSIEEVILKGLSWVIGNGREIRFWTDRWLSNQPLCELVIATLPENYQQIRACDLWRQDGIWDFSQITQYVPERVMLQIVPRVVDTITGVNDRISWGGRSDGNFSVKSAYDMMTMNDSPKQQMAGFFSRIWRTVTTERVRVFLWLASQQALMTNVERTRRHLGSSEICQVCRGGNETIIHVLRDCPAMAGVWNRIIPTRRRSSFFTQSLLEWLFQNLGDENEHGGCPWATVFSQAVWWGWKWRCINVFGGQGRCRDRVKFITDSAKEVWMAHQKVKDSMHTVTRSEQLIAWSPPNTGWVKLNTDGASHGNPGAATAGGALRDDTGTWCGGFAVNIGICTAPLAELWGVYYGLCIAWAKGFRRVEVEVDSAIVVGFLNTGISDSHPLSFLVRLCYGFVSKDWIVRIKHVYREANRLADGLANYAFSLPLGFHLLDVMPDDVRSIVFEDSIGTARPRSVRL